MYSANLKNPNKVYVNVLFFSTLNITSFRKSEIHSDLSKIT